MRSCDNAGMRSEVKTIGASGQISLGKQYAGRTVTIDEVEPGVWHIKTAQVIPDNELWLHTPEAKAKLDRALEWSATHPRKQSDLKALQKRIMRGK
jgi:hypothetical protein